MTKPMWKPLAEMDMDDGTHTCYYWETDSHYCYLTQISNGTWDVELMDKTTKYLTTLQNCKTLISAKRWFTRYCL